LQWILFFWSLRHFFCEKSCGSGSLYCVASNPTSSSQNFGCRECLTSADCNGAPCNSQGICGLCSTSSDCKSNSRCAGVECLDSLCVVNSSLLVDCTGNTASGKTICNKQTSECVQCATSADCTSSSTPYCLPSTYTCVQCQPSIDASCRSDNNCASVCDSLGSCINLGSSPLQCPTGKSCNTATGVCAQCTGLYCDSDSSCGPTCNAGQCVGSGTPCAGNTHCNNGVCSQCKTAAQCQPSQTCTNGECVACTKASCANTPTPTPSIGATHFASTLVIISLLAIMLVLN